MKKEKNEWHFSVMKKSVWINIQIAINNKNSNKWCSYFSLVNIQRRISQGLKVLQYYTTKDWLFKNDNLRRLREKMSTVDQQKFDFNVEEVKIHSISFEKSIKPEMLFI